VLVVTVDSVPLNEPTSNGNAGPSRSPKSFCILLPVWGERYVQRFVEQSLPTLLAAGNIPALAGTLPTRFVFLTRVRDEAVIRSHRACALLRQVCEVEFLPIDDLIMSGNHSTTITLAWERAVRREGDAMLDIAFIFLVSDYVMADGSLATIARHMMAGVSAIQAGNFQLSEHAAEPWLRRRRAVAGDVLSLTSREMVRWGLNCLHPATIANIVNYPLCHNAHTNRLFWRVDRDVLIGRFYLLHQICIRPERPDFVIGSSSDYSFVAEMCPSGNVTVITDSDDYFVAEVQPYDHEKHFIRFGPIALPDLARSLSEWTTARHRLNAQETIVFHADHVSAQLSSAVAEAEHFIAAVTPLLEAPQPYRDHPYWMGAIAALKEAIARRETEVSEMVPAPPPVFPPETRTATAPSVLRRLRRWLRRTSIGEVPNVTRLHPRWRDYKMLAPACEQIAPPKTRLLVQAEDMTGLSDIFRRVPEAMLLSDNAPSAYTTQDVDAAFIGLVNVDLGAIGQSLSRIGPRMRPGGQILAVILITDGFVDPEHLGTDHALGLALLAASGLVAMECRISTIGRWCWWLNRSSARAVKDLGSWRRRLSPFTWAKAGLWTVLALAVNLINSFRPATELSGRGVVSSVLMRFRAEGTAVAGEPERLAYKTASLNDMAAYANIFDGVTRWVGRVPKGYLVDFCGAMTDVAFTSESSDQRFRLMIGSDGAPADVYGNLCAPLPTLGDGEPWFEAANWVMATREARGRFVMMTLGANYGAQAVCSYRILQQLNPMPCELVAVEPVPENLEWTMRHFRDNGLDPDDHWLVPHALGPDIAPILFPIGAPGSGAQNAIATNNEEARQQYVERLSQGDGDTARAALRNLLLNHTTGLTRFVGDGEKFKTEIKLVSAITLHELLMPFDRVDYIEADIQQSEIVVFPPFIDLLRRKVRRIHIGTHGKDAHWSLHELFGRNGWRIVFSFEPNARFETALGSFETNDGVLTVVNPDL
jgi:hypothetical protein